MGSSSSRRSKTVAPLWQNMGLIDSTLNADLIKQTLAQLESKIDRLRDENKAILGKSIEAIKVMIQPPTQISAGTILKLEKLMQSLIHFLDNHEHELAKQKLIYNSIGYSVKKTIVAGIFGAIVGALVTSGDMGNQFDEEESRGLTLATGAVATTIMIINELYSGLKINNIQTKQLLLAENKAVLEFDNGITSLREKLKQPNEKNEQVAINPEKTLNGLLVHLQITTHALQILASSHDTEAYELAIQFEEMCKTLDGKSVISKGALDEVNELIMQESGYRKHQLKSGTSAHGAQQAAFAILDKSEKEIGIFIKKLNMPINSTEYQEPSSLRLE